MLSTMVLLESAFGIVSVGSSLTCIDYKQKPMCWITSPVSLFTDDCSLNAGIQSQMWVGVDLFFTANEDFSITISTKKTEVMY